MLSSDSSLRIAVAGLSCVHCICDGAPPLDRKEVGGARSQELGGTKEEGEEMAADVRVSSSLE